MPLSFPGITSSAATNPLSWIQEAADGFGADPTGISSYNAVALAQNISFPINNTRLDIFSAGSFFKYSMQTGGHNFPFHIDVAPTNITFLNLGMAAPSLSSPSNTPAASYQFLMKYVKSYGTASLNDTWLFLLGSRPVSTTLSVTPQDKVMAGMDWLGRELKEYSTNPISTSTIPTLASITDPVVIDADAGTNTPLSVDGDDYPTNGFSVTVNTGLISQAYNGSGYIDISAPGTNETTGTFSVPVGANGTALEDLLLSNQTGVDIDYTFKNGTMVLHITGAILETGSLDFPGQPTSIMEIPISFTAAQATLATS